MAIKSKTKAKEGKTSKTSHRTPAQIRQHYKDYQGKPEQIKKRSLRNAARRKLEKEGKVKKGDSKDVDHKKMLKDGGSNARSNLKAVSRKENRGWERKTKSAPKAKPVRRGKSKK